MEFAEFKENLMEQIKFNASSEMTSDKEEFLNYVTEALIEAEEIEDFIFLPFEGIGQNRRKIQIEGYSYNELDEYLTIFIAPTLTFFSQEILTNTEAEKIFARARAFIEDAEYIVSKGEDSSAGYGLAIDILNRYSKVRKYCIYLLTDMEMSKSIKELSATKLLEKDIEYQIWDITRLYQLAESKTGKEDIVINLKEFTEHGVPYLPASSTEDYTAYLCNIPGSVLAKLYNTYGGRLLEGNVRSFLQTKGKVNKGIRNTILNNPEMFFAYNNGIAATAFEMKTESYGETYYITEITALQIVNGGQTIASLAMALLEDKRDGSEENLKKIYVPMKLSVVSPEKSQELIPNISRYANSQNKVSDADLWSNHPFHIRMEEISRRIVAPATGGRQYGTHWYYERANGQYKQETYKATEAQRKRFEMQNPKHQMFNKTELAKFMNTSHALPHIVSAGGQKSFAKFAEWASAQWEKAETNFNEAYFRRIVSMAIIFLQSDKIVKKQSWYNSYKANIVAYTIAKIIYTVKMEYPEKAIDYRNIWLKQGLSIAWVNQIEVLSKQIYELLIDDSRQVENVTEWAKRESCWEAAKKMKIELSPHFLSELMFKTNEVEQQSDARREQRLTNNVSAMIKVADFGLVNWKDLMQWDETHKVLSPIDKDFINTVLGMEKGGFPSEKQCGRILQVLEKARLEGFPK